MDLSANLENTESDEYQSSGRQEPQSEEDYERYQEGSGWSLLMYSHCSVVLDETNGVSINSNRCYSGGHLELLRGTAEMELMPNESEMARLRSIAEGLGCAL